MEKMQTTISSILMTYKKSISLKIDRIIKRTTQLWMNIFFLASATTGIHIPKVFSTQNFFAEAKRAPSQKSGGAKKWTKDLQDPSEILEGEKKVSNQNFSASFAIWLHFLWSKMVDTSEYSKLSEKAIFSRFIFTQYHSDTDNYLYYN